MEETQGRKNPVNPRFVAWTSNQASGAIPNGTVIEKSLCDDAVEAHQVGDRGTVAGSIGPLTDGPYKGEYAYFIRWDDNKELPIFTSGHKVRPV